MATKKTNGSGFNAPAIGTVHPRGSTVRKNADGTITVVHPKKSTSKSKGSKR